MTELRRFAVDDGRDLADLVDGLAQRARFERDDDRLVERTIVDTFDWRLRGRRMSLELERTPAPARPRPSAPSRASGDGSQPWLVWRSTDTGAVLGRIPVDAVPTFAADLAASPTRDRLASVVEMRALLELATVRSEQVSLRLVDEEGKTQVRIVMERSELLADCRTPPTAGTRPADTRPTTTLPTVVEVIPVRGYDKAAASVYALLGAQVVLRPLDRDVVDEALKAMGHAPGSYSSKLVLRHAPDAVALDVFVAILGALLATMATNEAGTRADLDTEFLHDFRVAVRRTRSMLAMAARVIPPDRLGYLRDEFKWLGDVTTPTRDLDVYLLGFGDFEAAVAESRRGDLAPLRSFLERHQVEAHAELVAALDSPRYRALMADYKAWLADPTAEPGASDSDVVPDAGRPAHDVAAERTWKAYRKLVRDGRRITSHSPPQRLHDLRKDAKKLRYALECFGSLFPAAEIAAGVKELKGVQDVLGTFQDCEVQKASLEGFGQEMITEGGPSQAAALMAMGALVEQLDDREAKARADFAERWERFDDRVVRARFRRLFAPASGRSGAAVGEA